MSVKEVKPLPADSRFSYEPSQSSLLTLQAGHKSHVGRLVFDPKVECGSECYAGFPLTSKGKAGAVGESSSCRGERV